MKTLIAALAAAGALSLPSLAAAQETDPMKMTCAEFSAMDDAGKMEAVTAMGKAAADGAMAMADGTMAMDDAAMKMAADTTAKGCDGKPDTKAMDAMMMK